MDMTVREHLQQAEAEERAQEGQDGQYGEEEKVHRPK